jgi:hypothetical protein
MLSRYQNAIILVIDNSHPDAPMSCPGLDASTR